MTVGPGRLEDLLVVEDNPGDVRLIEEAFSDADLETTVHVVSRGAKALDFVHQRGEFGDAPEPDVVLLDWNLHQMDAGELVSDIRSVYSHVPVAIITGSQAKREAIRSKASEADAYLKKPTEPAAYVEIARSLFSDSQ